MAPVWIGLRQVVSWPDDIIPFMLRSRYRRILWFFGRILLVLIFWDIVLPRLGLARLSRRTRPARLKKYAAGFRLLAIQLGGVMIKAGQFLSARLDVLPREVTDELSGLQDEVLPEALDDIRQIIEHEFGLPLEDMYCWFEETPVAAASIGQVHRARTCSSPGESETPPVVVKVQRPDIERIVSTDLSALRVVAGWVQKYPPIRKRMNVSLLLEEFSQSLSEEIDYLNEGKNAEVFAANFSERPDVRVPHVYWSHTTRRVLTLEDVQAIKITDYAAIEAAGISRAEVANRLLDAYLQQIFEDSFFHADPHPGNLFVLPEPKSEDGTTPWRLVFVDFGMTGKISPGVLAGMRELLIAVGVQDGARVVKAYQMLGVLLPGADLELLAQANQQAFRRFWGKTTTELVDMGHAEIAAFAREFGDLLYEMPFQIPQNFILLGRCLGILSGICTGLDANFNVWQGVMPYATRLINEERGGVWRYGLTEATATVRLLAGLPRRVDSLLARMEEGRLEVRSSELRHEVGRLGRAVRRLAVAVFFAAFLLGAVQLYLAGENTLAAVLGTAAVLTLLGFLLR
ncbi:MAG: AarF/ABC1/UbiB kinase family protein [Anaerolineaceae bacterium]|nr:AarF/ABC1/UbiB kinase family protein [Anaerolineaceae bacterium]